MNTEQAKLYLDCFTIVDRSIFDSQDTEHPLEYLLEDYHQEQLKLLSKNNIKKFTVGEILKELEDSETLDDAIMYFKELNNKSFIIKDKKKYIKRVVWEECKG